MCRSLSIQRDIYNLHGKVNGCYFGLSDRKAVSGELFAFPVS